MDREDWNQLVSFFEGERAEADDFRKPFEDMWIDGYRAFFSEYDPSQVFREGGSNVYYGLTRQKCLTAYHRETDILFNRPDLPWQIEPTPEPEVPVKRVVDFLFSHMPEQIQQEIMMQGLDRMVDLLPKETFQMAEKALAHQACKKMSKVIEDQWREDKTSLKIKQGILEKVITGTCILKFGTTGRENMKWECGKDSFAFAKKTTYTPTTKHVSIFDVWFDPHAKLQVDNGTIDSCDYVYERHKLTHAQMRDLADKPAFIKEAIFEILRDGPEQKETTSDSDMRTIWGGAFEPKQTGYDVYERTGYLTNKQLRDLGGIEVEGEDYDYVNMNIWYCAGRIIKAIKVPFKGSKLPYFVVPQEIAPGQLYGLGVPYKMRHSQTLLNSSIRLYIDTKANASGPITFVDEDAWESSDAPEDALRPWGMPRIKVPVGKRLGDVVMFKEIPDVSEFLRPLIELSKHQADEESGIPAFSHAAQNSELTKATGGTASGMSMILGAADLAHKAAVRNIDDFLTTPLLESYYHWNMQFNPDEEIKGDMEVVALGTIGVMRQEVQAQRLVQLITQTANPVDAQLFPRDELWYDVADAFGLDVQRYRQIATQRKEQAAKAQQMMEAMGGGQMGPGGPQGPSGPPQGLPGGGQNEVGPPQG